MPSCAIPSCAMPAVILPPPLPGPLPACLPIDQAHRQFFVDDLKPVRHGRLDHRFHHRHAARCWHHAGVQLNGHHEFSRFGVQQLAIYKPLYRVDECRSVRRRRQLHGLSQGARTYACRRQQKRGCAASHAESAFVPPNYTPASADKRGKSVRGASPRVWGLWRRLLSRPRRGLRHTGWCESAAQRALAGALCCRFCRRFTRCIPSCRLI